MKVRIEKDRLARYLSLLQTVTERKTLPYLSHILLKATDGKIYMAATDLDIALEVQDDVEVIDEGAMTAPARRLLDVVKEFPEEEIEIKAKNGSFLCVTTGNANFELPSFDPEDFPLPPPSDDLEFQTCNRDVFRNALRKTSYAVPSVESPLGGPGLYWSFEGGNIHRFVGCELNRLASYMIVADELGMSQLPFNVMIPQKGVKELLKFTDENEYIELCLTELGLYARSNKMRLWVKLLEDYFGFYDDLVSPKRSYGVNIPSQDFKRALKRMAIFTDQTWKYLKMHFEDNSLFLEAGNPEIGMGREKINVEYDLKPYIASFDLRYVMDAVGVIQGEWLRFEWDEEAPGGIFLDLEDEAYLALIMPLVVP